MKRTPRNEVELKTSVSKIKLRRASGRTKTFITILFLSFSAALLGQGTAGTVDISVTSKPNGIDHSPKHVLAIWVEDDAGDFVKTIKLRGDKRKEWLKTWQLKSNYNTTDAITGATLSSHTTHDVSWNCTNTSGTVVDDGDYAVRVEYTSEHDQGPITSIAFTKAADAVTFQPSDETYFVDMDLVYTPESTTGIDNIKVSYDLSVYPNPASDQLTIKMSNPADRHTSIMIYQADLRLINVVWDGDLGAGEHAFTWNLRSMSGAKVAAGTYFMVVSGNNMLSTRQVVVK